MKELKAKGHGLRRWLNAWGYSRDGFRAAADEAGFRELLLLHGLLLLALIFIPFTFPVKMALLLSSGLSLLCELFNSAVEACVDLVTEQFHPLAKRAKDIASAAQLLSLLLVALAWLLALFNL